MKRLNKKGFTLIELLAVIIILGVLLLIAVPSVSKYITESRMDTYKTNLTRLVDAVSNEVNSYSGEYSFRSDEFLIIPLVCIEVEKGSNTKSPFGLYEHANSFVAVTRKYATDSEGNSTGVPTGFKYYVAALDENGFGATMEDLQSANFKVSGEPKLTTIEVDTAATQTTPATYKLTGTNIPSAFTTDIAGKTGKLITCDAYNAG